MGYAKWAVVPLLIVVTQIALNSVDAFSSQPVVWTFIAVACGILLYWRSRLQRVLLDPVLNEPPPKEFALLNRRFAMLANSFCRSERLQSRHHVHLFTTG